jgi:hypothetical protein
MVENEESRNGEEQRHSSSIHHCNVDNVDDRSELEVDNKVFSRILIDKQRCGTLVSFKIIHGFICVFPLFISR